MKDVSWYWSDKELRREIAENHTVLMNTFYGNEISRSARKSQIYTTDFPFLNVESKHESTTCIVVPEDTVEAIINHSEDKTAVLNFASFTHPGGGFMKGSRAQEECLCHASFLYNVLARYQNIYKVREGCKNKGLYMNDAIYSPDILFSIEEQKKTCNVITCAAPNYTAANKYCKVSKAKNTEALGSRIDFVLNIAADQEIDTLILGAYGCGVFGQDATEVATIFKKYLTTKYNHVFKNVYFAIPILNNDSENFDAFITVFSEEK